METARESLVRFLLLEIAIANTMLDAADTTQQEASRERRRSRAEKACAEVARYLGEERKHLTLRGPEREQLVEGLGAVRARMTSRGQGAVRGP